MEWDGERSSIVTPPSNHNNNNNNADDHGNYNNKSSGINNTTALTMEPNNVIRSMLPTQNMLTKLTAISILFQKWSISTILNPHILHDLNTKI